jgi:hypothetical protein
MPDKMKMLNNVAELSADLDAMQKVIDDLRSDSKNWNETTMKQLDELQNRLNVRRIQVMANEIEANLAFPE